MSEESHASHHPGPCRWRPRRDPPTRSGSSRWTWLRVMKLLLEVVCW